MNKYPLKGGVNVDRFDGAFMNDKSQRCNVVTTFEEWYERRYARQHGPLAGYALDRCEETFTRRAWDSFAYWHAIYVRERRKAPHFTTPQVSEKD
jgi:tRNA nucleotidyltransferase (CCA-adding enzyme)